MGEEEKDMKRRHSCSSIASLLECIRLFVFLSIISNSSWVVFKDGGERFQSVKREEHSERKMNWDCFEDPLDTVHLFDDHAMWLWCKEIIKDARCNSLGFRVRWFISSRSILTWKRFIESSIQWTSYSLNRPFIPADFLDWQGVMIIHSQQEL